MKFRYLPTIAETFRNSSQTGRLRSLRGAFERDTRGVSEVLGGILVFGLLIAVLVLIQANAVPSQNQQVEFEHNQRLHQDMLELDRAILHTATDAVPSSAQLELSARYPTRFFLFNPSEGAGTIESLESGPVVVANARADSAPNYWDGTDRSFDTRLIRYRPNYNEYRNAPVTVYEHNTLINQFESGAVLPLDSTSFIQRDQITLVLIDGQLSTASTSAIALETASLSGPARTTTITNDGTDDITISLPTTLTDEQWESILDAETIANGGNITEIEVTTGDPFNMLTVTLAPGSYELRMARVGVAGNVDESVLGPHYLVADDGQTSSIRQGETRVVTAEIRDRYNNPETGEVMFSTTSASGSFARSDGTTASAVTVSSNESGYVSATFIPNSNFVGTATVVASQDFDASGNIEAREEVSVPVTVIDANLNYSRNDPNGVSSVNPGSPGSVRLNSINHRANTLTLTLENTGTADQTIERMRLAFYLSNSIQGVDYGRVNNDPNDQLDLYGDWDETDQTIVIPAGGTETFTIRFSPQTTPGDFLGISVEYDGAFANYYIQLPQN